MIRQANQKDIFKVSLLWLRMVRELAPELKPNVNWWRSHCERFIGSGDYFLYVAEIEGKMVGFIDFFMFAEPATSKYHCIGQHFFVLFKHRKSNVAGRLYKKVLTESAKFGAQSWELFCFEKERPVWERHGFNLRRCLMRK